eukprot:2630438-Pyramimonas_sp.AAC.1
MTDGRLLLYGLGAPRSGTAVKNSPRCKTGPAGKGLVFRGPNAREEKPPRPPQLAFTERQWAFTKQHCPVRFLPLGDLTKRCARWGAHSEGVFVSALYVRDSCIVCRGP